MQTVEPPILDCRIFRYTVWITLSWIYFVDPLRSLGWGLRFQVGFTGQREAGLSEVIRLRAAPPGSGVPWGGRDCHRTPCPCQPCCFGPVWRNIDSSQMLWIQTRAPFKRAVDRSGYFLWSMLGGALFSRTLPELNMAMVLYICIYVYTYKYIYIYMY